MASKKINKKMNSLAEEISNCYKDWEQAYNYGSAEMFWADGMHLNLIMRKIKRLKSEMADEMAADKNRRNPIHNNKYPDVFYKDLPPELDNEYIAIPNKILDKSLQVVEQFEQNPDYQYILNHINDVFPNEESTDISEALEISFIPTMQLRNYRKIIESGNIIEIRRVFYFMDVEKKIRQIKDTADKFKQVMQLTPQEKAKILKTTSSLDNMVQNAKARQQSHDLSSDELDIDYDSQER